MAGELAGKVAIVTGGSSGIGLGSAARFVAEGAKVVIADVNEEAGQAAAAELGPDAAFRRTDVADQAQVAELVDFAVSTFGGLHVMFNNAGISGARHPRLLDEDFADFDKVMGINLLGVMAGTREAARHMAANGGGSIINTTSIGGIQHATGQWAYHVSKAGVIMFSKSAAIDLGEYSIRVNCIAPGNIETPIMGGMMAQGRDMSPDELDAMMAKVRAFLLARQPIHRQGTTEDLAQAALFYASDRSSYVTGTVLPVDGGQLAGTPTSASGFESLRPPGEG
jgi:NAD(P)-dependent dehydrogenase (short-subunit alcohol dehydrogenase family)